MIDGKAKYRAGQIVHVRVRTCYSGPDSDGDWFWCSNSGAFCTFCLSDLVRA